MQLPEFLLDLKSIVQSEQPLYLVGGAVRDFLLGIPCKDYDIVCTADTQKIARQFADKQKGDFFTLDETRKTYRVLVERGSAQRIEIDFATMLGESIEEDLEKRDFTINAMAVAINNPGQIVDPHKGGRDLQEKWLRPVDSESFIADPLRVIRAIRYSVNLGLKLEPTTSSLIRNAVEGLDLVSSERKRDELFKILNGKRIHTSVMLMRQFGILDYFPFHMDQDISHLIDLCRELEEVLDWLTGSKEIEKQAAFHQVSLLVQLGRFTKKFQDHFLRENPSNRTRKALLFATLLACAKSEALFNDNLRALTLAACESEAIEKYRRGREGCDRIINYPTGLSPKQIHEYYQNTGSAGVDLVISNLAEYRTRLGAEFSQEVWMNRLMQADALLDAWWEHPEIIRPVPMLNGDEIQQLSQLMPGPIIGELLDELVGLQLTGTIKTKEAALKWLASWISD